MPYYDLTGYPNGNDHHTTLSYQTDDQDTLVILCITKASTYSMKCLVSLNEQIFITNFKTNQLVNKLHAFCMIAVGVCIG